jgi:flagellar biosynthetic protein FlhB
VPKATVLATNFEPRRGRLRYQPTMAAPRLAAKGTGASAERIRAIAHDPGVPIARSPPLARALHGPSNSTSRFRLR